MKLYANLDVDRQHAEEFIGYTVRVESNKYAKLCSIYTDVFDTTLGTYATIEVEKGMTGKCEYKARYCELLPVLYKSRKWLINGHESEISLVYSGEHFTDKPYRDYNGALSDIIKDTIDT